MLYKYVKCLTVLAVVSLLTSENAASSCSSESTCSSCIQSPGCAFLNSECTDDPKMIIKNKHFDSENEYIYCKNAPRMGAIQFDGDKQNSFDLSALPGASAAAHSLCEWRFSVSGTVTININRNFNGYEDLYLHLRTKDTDMYYSSRDFSTCGNSSLTLSASDVSYLVIKVEILNDASNYVINISQNSKSSPQMEWIVFLIPIFFIVFGCCIISCIVTLWLRDRILKKRQLLMQRDHFFKCIQNRPKRIQDTMSNMRNGKFSNIKKKYMESACVVCLEDFLQEDNVHVTNECSHTLHSACLKEWFKNINPTKDLICPHCSTACSHESNHPDVGELSIESGDSEGINAEEPLTGVPILSNNYIKVHPEAIETA